MTLKRLNKLLAPHLMKADLCRRPGYGLDNVAGEYEIWVKKFKTLQEYSLEADYAYYSKMGKGITLEQAMKNCIENLKQQNIELT